MAEEAEGDAARDIMSPAHTKIISSTKRNMGVD